MINFLKKNRLVSLLLSAISLSLVYFGGFFSSDTLIEKVAACATDAVVNHTENKKYCAITVGTTTDSGPLVDSDSEFHQLYGVFRQQKITFASGMNVNKSHDINLGQSISDNLSVLYVGPTGTIEYNGHYKHYVSPIEVMFADNKNYDINKYVIYISQAHADKLLDSDPSCHRDENNQYGKNDYKSLLKKNIPLYIDGNKHTVLIQNIYYQMNYYYEGLNDVMGDFIISSYYFPQDLRTEQQNIYFMSEYTYQNEFFMKYINNTYSSKKFDVKLNHYNLVDNVDDSYILSFYYSNNVYTYNWVAIFMFVIAGILLVFSSIIVIYQNKICTSHSKIWLVVNVLVLFVPYLFFKLAFLVTKNIAFLSIISSKVTIWFIVAFVLVEILVPIFISLLNKKRLSNGDFYAVDI